MKFSESWLRSWVNPNVSSDELMAQLTMAGLEVDGCEAVAAEFSGVVVGKVLTRGAHPDADKLQVCTVDVGSDEPLQIVCGASNVRVGMRAPVAMVGARLPGFKIKKSKLRGVASYGMLCSEAEIGLADSADGLMDLPLDAPIGTDIREYLGLEDSAIDVDLTPNRGDCLGISGIAREVAVFNRVPVTAVEIEDVAASTQTELAISVEASEACPRYLGRVIAGIDILAQTPLWMVERLRRGGIRSLGPSVDVTNYVLLELGQPMHAFDKAQLHGAIQVRYAKPDEAITLLDGKPLVLDSDSLVIADDQGPVALAGIMGGERSGVNNTTQDLFLECAWFTPVKLAGKARSYGLHTDSSHRFERGVDFELQHRAMQRATGLILEIMGGQAGPMTEVLHAEHLPQRNPVSLRRDRIERNLGLSVADEDVEDILRRLDMTLEASEQGWLVTPPSFRFDIEIEADLIEELARIVGYDQIPETLPTAPLTMGARPEARIAESRAEDLLVDRGYQQAITYSFVDPERQQALLPDAVAVPLANPLSADLSVMRLSIWTGLLGALAHNLKRQQEWVRLFESGLVFLPGEGDAAITGMQQLQRYAGVAAGSRQSEQWGDKSEAMDFYDLKADVEALLALSGRNDWQFIAPQAGEEHPALHPGQSARICDANGKAVGWIGGLHPRLLKGFGLKRSVYLFEIDAEAITMGQVPAYHSLSKFPRIRRDLAVLVDEAVSAGEVLEIIRSSAGEHLESVQLFDVYRGTGVEIGRKSLALGLILQDSSRTLTDQDVDLAVSRAVDQLKQQVGASLRD